MTDSQDLPALPQIRAELLQIIGEALGQELPTILDDTPILDFVLSSLALVEGMRRVYEHFGVLISIRRVIESQATLGGLALYIEQELHAQRLRQSAAAAAPKTQAKPAAAAARQIRLAPSQQHVGWLARYSSEAAAAFNEAVAVRLDGPLDAPALQAAIDLLAARYEALRASISLDRDELSVGRGEPLELQVAQCHDQQLEQRLIEVVGQPFALGERLFRVALLRQSEARHVLVLVGHAVVVDVEALHGVLADLATAYSAY